MPLRSVLFVNVAVLLVMAGFVSPAQALVQKVVKDNIDSVAEYAYRSGGTGISGGSCGSTCTSIWNVQHTPPPNPNPVATEAVNRQLVELNRGVKTLPKASLIGKISLGLSAFSIGLWIGDTINDKLLHIGGPAAPASPSYTGFSLAWIEKGTGLGDVGLVAPQDGFYLWASPNNVRAFKRWTGKSEGACSNLDPQPSEYVDLTVGKDGCYLGGSETGWRELHAYVYGKPFEVLGPIEDFDEDEYNVRIGDWPDEPTSMEELGTRVEDVIESDELPLANAHFAHALEPENFPDPRITDEEEDHRCDRAPASYMNPGGNVSPEPFAKHIATPFTITNRPFGYASVDVYLHEGETHWIPGRNPETSPWHIDEWGGWGYRHILAKHGWGATDLEETQLALTNATPVQQKGTNYLYSLPLKTGGDGGVGCIRQVVVDFEAGLEDPRPRGIVTSFNQAAP
jgi:hypothetical protein